MATKPKKINRGELEVLEVINRPLFERLSAHELLDLIKKRGKLLADKVREIVEKSPNVENKDSEEYIAVMAANQLDLAIKNAELSEKYIAEKNTELAVKHSLLAAKYCERFYVLMTGKDACRGVMAASFGQHAGKTRSDLSRERKKLFMEKADWVSRQPDAKSKNNTYIAKRVAGILNGGSYELFNKSKLKEKTAMNWMTEWRKERKKSRSKIP